MTPEDVTADIELLVAFYATLGRDAPSGGRDELDRDLDLLLGIDGVRLVAWHWPDPAFDPLFDPLAADPRPDADDRRRRVLGANLHQFMVSAAAAAGVPLADVKTHVAWSSALSPRDMARLEEGLDHDLRLVVALCDALQLEFAQHWLITDPQRLRGRIEQSLIAVEISLRLRDLTADNLAAVLRKLPKGSRTSAALKPEAYIAPRVGSRYRPLYEALAADTRDSPTYSVIELHRILKAGGGPGLPKSAWRDVSWWSGAGNKAEGRPQISAWWAAGLRIGRMVRAQGSPSDSEVLDIWFDALPGRSTWLQDPHRTEAGEYRLPGPHKVPIKLRRGGSPVKDLSEPPIGTPPAEPQGPSDPEVAELVELLTLHGEADRTLIEAHFKQSRLSGCSAGWLTSLLTRARRQGWTVNHGTRRHPRWVAAGTKGDLMLEIAALLGFECPHVGKGSPIPAEFFLLVAAGTGLTPPEGMSGGRVARSIMKALGQDWREDHQGSIAFSAGGLAMLRNAIRTKTRPEQVAE